MPVFLFSIDIAKISFFIENSRKTLLILVKLRSALFLKRQNSLDIERGGCGFREHCSLNAIMRFIVGQARCAGLERIAGSNELNTLNHLTGIWDWLDFKN